MRRTIWYNNTIPQEQQFTNETLSRIEELLERFRDTSTRGIRAGLKLQITPNTSGLQLTITAGQGYNPVGERIHVLSDVTNIQLGPTTVDGDPVEYLSTDGFQVRANGSYEDGAHNYVVLRYIEEPEAPLQERILDRQHDSIMRPSFEVEVLTEEDFEALVGHHNVDVAAVPFPELDPKPSRDFRVLVGIVIGNGVGVALTDANIIGVDPGITQPQQVTGVTITTVSNNTPPGLGRIHYNATAGTLAWRAPTNSVEGIAVAVPATPGFVTLTSSDTTLSTTVRVTPDSLPEIEIEESVSVVTRLDLTFPQPGKQPEAVTGVTLRKVSLNTSVGDGTLSFDPATTELFWAAPGDTVGLGVDLTGGGSVLVRSANTALSLTVFVDEGSLPTAASPDFDPATGLVSEEVEIRGLYDLAIPIQSADDLLHRGLVGSGTPTARNPHGLTLADILDSSEDDVFKDHQDFFHKNGITHDAASDFLEITVDSGDDDKVVATPPASSDDIYLIDGVLHRDVQDNEFVFTDSMGTGFYFVHMNPDETLGATRISDLAVLGSLDDNTLPNELPPVRIRDIKNSLTPNVLGTTGQLKVLSRIVHADATATYSMAQWQAPGDTAFGPLVRLDEDMTLYSANGDWVRVTFNFDEMNIDWQDETDGETLSYVIYLDSAVTNEDKILPLASVLWDQTNERILDVFDLRRFATADNRDQLDELTRDVEQAAGDALTLSGRIRDDRSFMHDNGIVGLFEHNSRADRNVNALLVERADSNALVNCYQPDEGTSFYVHGRKHEAIAAVGTSDGPPEPAGSPAQFDFSMTAAINSIVAGTPDQVCTLNFLVVDEFGILKSYTRVREDADIATKAIPGFQITNISNDFNENTAPSLQYVPDSPSPGLGTITLFAGGGAGTSVRVADEEGTWRLYGYDGLMWVEVSRVPTAPMPVGPSTITVTFSPLNVLDESRYLEVGRVAYDGSAEVVNIIDTRRFGTIGRRSLGTDALHQLTRKQVGIELIGETHRDGVLRGLEVTGVNATEWEWVPGVAMINGKEFQIEEGTQTVTTQGGVRFVYVDADGAVKFSEKEEFDELLPGRRVALLAKIYVTEGSTEILNIEDRRLFPGTPTPIGGRRYSELAHIRGQRLLAGFDPNPPYRKSSPNRSAGIFLNCYRNSDNGAQAPTYWLENTELDGLMALAVQNMDTTKLPMDWTLAGPGGYSDNITSSNFAFFRIPAGENPRPAEEIEVLGLPTLPLEVKKGGEQVLEGDDPTFTRILDFAAGDFNVTTDDTGYTLVSTILPPGAEPGLEVETYGGIESAAGLVLNSGEGIKSKLLKGNIQAEAGDPILINVSTQVQTTSGQGGLAARVAITLNNQLITYGNETSHMSLPKDQEVIGISFSLKGLCSAGNNRIRLYIESDAAGRPGISIADRIQWTAVVYHI